MAFTTTASGLQYEDTTVGDGAEATKGQQVTVHYTGWLYNDGVQGAKFDSSRDRNDPFVFGLGAGMVIKGWDEGVQGMKIGGQRTLIIPAALGYGARGAGGVIPPNATLKFDVELLKTGGHTKHPGRNGLDAKPQSIGQQPVRQSGAQAGHVREHVVGRQAQAAQHSGHGALARGAAPKDAQHHHRHKRRGRQ